MHHIFNGTMTTVEEREHMLHYQALGEKHLKEHIETDIITSKSVVTESGK